MSAEDLSGIDDAIAWLTAFPALVPAAAATALEGVAQAMTNDAQATARYQDDTGATRASTIAYTHDATGVVEGAGLVGAAYQGAETYNGDHAVVEEVPDPAAPGGVTVVLTTFTDYTDDLVTMQGGARDFLGSTLTQHAGALHDAATRGVADLFGGAG